MRRYGTCFTSGAAVAGAAVVVFLLLPFIHLTCAGGVLIGEDAAAAVTRFQEYLRIDTAHPSPNYFSAAAFLRSQAEAIGIDGETIEVVPGKPVVLMRWLGRRPSLPSILLNSHIDVVPSEAAKWMHPPFSAHLDEASGHIYARGSQDMKCVGMQYLEAIRRLRANNFTPERTVYVSFVPDEEIGGHDGVEAFIASEKFKDMNVGLALDEGLASLGEEYRVFYGERSPWWTVIKARGAPGHGAKLYDGSAMENVLKSMEAIRRFRDSQFDMVKAGVRPEGEVISVNFAFLKAGTPSPTGFVMNLQPSEAEIGIDIRVPPHTDTAALERRIAEEWAPSSRNMSFEFKQQEPTLDKFGRPAVTATDSSNPWWGVFEEAVKRAGGKLGKPEVFPASTDARFFRLMGIPALGFSPMIKTPILLHDHNEHLNKDVYLKGIGIYESIIRALSSHPEGTATAAAAADEDGEARAEL